MWRLIESTLEHPFAHFCARSDRQRIWMSTQGTEKKEATAFFAVAPGVCSSAFSLIGNSQVVNPANGILALCLAQNDDAQAGGATLVALLAAAKQAVTILIVPSSSEQE